jgi:hypothetical protein
MKHILRMTSQMPRDKTTGQEEEEVVVVEVGYMGENREGSAQHATRATPNRATEEEEEERSPSR